MARLSGAPAPTVEPQQQLGFHKAERATEFAKRNAVGGRQRVDVARLHLQKRTDFRQGEQFGQLTDSSGSQEFLDERGGAMRTRVLRGRTRGSGCFRYSTRRGIVWR